MRRALGVCLVLSCLLVSVPASASTGATLTASLTELASRWLVSLLIATPREDDPQGGKLEVGPSWDPNG